MVPKYIRERDASRTMRFIGLLNIVNTVRRTLDHLTAHLRNMIAQTNDV